MSGYKLFLLKGMCCCGWGHRENMSSAKFPRLMISSRGNFPNFSLTPIWPGYPQLGCYQYHQPIVLGSLWWRLWSTAINVIPLVLLYNSTWNYIAGTVLGPLVFLIHINDMTSRVTPGTCIIRLFANECLSRNKNYSRSRCPTARPPMLTGMGWSLGYAIYLNPNKWHAHQPG